MNSDLHNLPTHWPNRNYSYNNVRLSLLYNDPQMLHYTYINHILSISLFIKTHNIVEGAVNAVIFFQSSNHSCLLECCTQCLILAHKSYPSDAIPLGEINWWWWVSWFQPHNTRFHFRWWSEIVLANLMTDVLCITKIQTKTKCNKNKTSRTMWFFYIALHMRSKEVMKV